MESREQILEQQYTKLPNEIKEAKRWVCYRKVDKAPMNAINGKFAQSNNPFTWTTFRNAIIGCVKYNFDGLGFMLGNGIFGVDLDNHLKEDGTPEISQDEFDSLSSEFLNALDSYSERSQSGRGIHIICKGKLPEGACRKGNIEMYDSGRYFAMTGNVVNDQLIQNREEEIKPLWKKYLYSETKQATRTVKNPDGSVVFGTICEDDYAYENRLSLSDSEVIERIKASQTGDEFLRYYINGDTYFSDKNTSDHSRADLCLCCILAFWCGKDRNQMDRIFRSSALMRKKWDEYRGKDTYGNMTIDMAISRTFQTYNPPKEKVVVKDYSIENKASKIISNNNEQHSCVNENGDPIITARKKSFKTYSLDDTGNAERFYDYFGENFRFNKDLKSYMFWNKKTWVVDSKEFVKKYADELIKILKADANSYEDSIKQAMEEARPEDEIKKMQLTLKAMQENIKRVSNKAGKDAMLSELQHLHNIPVLNSEFDTQENLLNTDSGVVDLNTGEIAPYSQEKMLSKNTNCRVSYDEPTTWLKFLHDIFERPNQQETEELIECIQMALGYSLTGRKNKEHLFILYGNGSNGKSTFIEATRKIFGDYGKVMNSDLLIQSNASSQSNEFALSALLGARLVSTSETSEGGKLDETIIKKMTSGEEINAQFKYGQPFSFAPTFSPWLSTNNKPIIRATDFGTWRRLFFIPFLNTFTEEKKDVDMPKKIAAECDKILGWIIMGNVKLHNEYHDKLPKPKCIEEALADYKNEQDVINAFIQDRCSDFPRYKTRASVLYQEYVTWAKTNNEYLMPERKFGMEMTKKHYDKKRDRDGNYYVGIKLNSDHRGHIFSEDLDDEQ